MHASRMAARSRQDGLIEILAQIVPGRWTRLGLGCADDLGGITLWSTHAIAPPRRLVNPKLAEVVGVLREMADEVRA